MLSINLNTIIAILLESRVGIQKYEINIKIARTDLERYCNDGIRQLIGHYTEHLDLGHTKDGKVEYYLKKGEFYTKFLEEKLESADSNPFIRFFSYDEKTLIETARKIEEALKSLTPSG